MSDIYQARKEYTEWDMLEDERIRLGNHVPDGYLLSVPDEDVERLFCNLGAEGDKLLDNSRQKVERDQSFAVRTSNQQVSVRFWREDMHA